MRFAVKVIPLGVLGFATALLVACGSGDGLIPSDRADSLQEALASVQSACADGDRARAMLAAQRFSDRVVGLSPREVDPRLIAKLEDGAQQLETLATTTCEGTTGTTTVPTTPTETVPTTTVPTETTPETTPTETIPTTTVPTTPTTPPDNGGGAQPGDGTSSGGAGVGGEDEQ
jgi:hypothetical protein